MQRRIAHRRAVLARLLFADQHRVAVPKYLQAIDYTAGLMRRLEKMNINRLPGASTREILERLVVMRQLAQEGLRLDNLAQNWAVIQGAGEKLLSQIEQREERLVPAAADFAAFTKSYPNNVAKAQEVQTRNLLRIISKELKVPIAALEPRILGDRGFMEEAFVSVAPAIAQLRAPVVRAIAPVARAENAEFSSRTKDTKSIWGKQKTKGRPFTSFGDLFGCRAIAADFTGICRVASAVQNSLGLVEKDNRYSTFGDYYNGINYALISDWLVVEFQLKADVNRIEAALTHDLVYSKEKAVVQLSDEEKRLVKMVIDVSTQLSMTEWAEIAGLGADKVNLRGG